MWINSLPPTEIPGSAITHNKYEVQAYENEQCVDANHIKREMTSNKDYK